MATLPVQGVDKGDPQSSDALIQQYLAQMGNGGSPQIINQLRQLLATNPEALQNGSASIGGAALPSITPAPNPPHVIAQPIDGLARNGNSVITGADGDNDNSETATGPNGTTTQYRVGGADRVQPSSFENAFNKASADATNGGGQGPAGLKSNDGQRTGDNVGGATDPTKAPNGVNNAPSKPADAWGDSGYRGEALQNGGQVVDQGGIEFDDMQPKPRGMISQAMDRPKQNLQALIQMITGAPDAINNLPMTVQQPEKNTKADVATIAKRRRQQAAP